MPHLLLAANPPHLGVKERADRPDRQFDHERLQDRHPPEARPGSRGRRGQDHGHSNLHGHREKKTSMLLTLLRDCLISFRMRRLPFSTHTFG